MRDELFARFIAILVVLLFVFGVPYAYLITTRPFRPDRTYQSVIVGDFVTDLGMAALLYLLTGNLIICSIPFVCHAMTGGPMIVGQLIKHRMQNGGHVVIEDEDDDKA